MTVMRILSDHYIATGKLKNGKLNKKQIFYSIFVKALISTTLKLCEPARICLPLAAPNP